MAFFFLHISSLPVTGTYMYNCTCILYVKKKKVLQSLACNSGIFMSLVMIQFNSGIFMSLVMIQFGKYFMCTIFWHLSNLNTGLKLIQGHPRPWPLMPSEMALMPFQIFVHLRPKISALFCLWPWCPVVILCMFPMGKYMYKCSCYYWCPFWMALDAPLKSTPLAVSFKCPFFKWPCPFEFLIPALQVNNDG